MSSKSMTMLVLCLLMPLIASCQHGTGGSTFCLTESPIRYTATERSALSPASKAQALEHNRRGAKECGWRAQQG